MRVFPNLEMGDNIVCNGMIRYLATQHEKLEVVTRRTYHADISRMYSDLPNVTCIDGYDYPEARAALIQPDSILMGYFKDPQWKADQWDREFYEQAGVDFEIRWRGCKFPTVVPKEFADSGKPWVLLHDVPHRGINIHPAYHREGRIKMELRHSFWDWVPMMLRAQELHLVDSSYLNLAESLWSLGLLEGTRLVFHRYAKVQRYGSVPPVLRGPWEIID